MDIQGINGHEVIREPVRVKFRNPKTGKWLKGISEPQIDQNHFRIWLNVKAYAPCRVRKHRGYACDCKKRLVGVRDGPANLLTNQFAAFVQYFVLGNTSLNTNPKRLSDGAATAVSGANTACLGRAGTTNTAAAVTDTALGAQTETVAATVNANPTTGTTSGTFTVTFTITAGADRVYVEVGLGITNNTNLYLLCHDVFSALNVSNTGTLAVTYTFTNS